MVGGCEARGFMRGGGNAEIGVLRMKRAAGKQDRAGNARRDGYCAGLFDTVVCAWKRGVNDCGKIETSRKGRIRKRGGELREIYNTDSNREITSTVVTVLGGETLKKVLKTVRGNTIRKCGLVF